MFNFFTLNITNQNWAYVYKTGNPGSPVVSSVNCHTNTILKYVDFHLQPIATNIPSYVSGTTDFLQKLDEVKNILKWLLTCNTWCEVTVHKYTKKWSYKSVAYGNQHNKTVATKVIITFLSLILTLNNFVFNSINYLQIMDVQWIQFVLQHTQIFPWHNLKSNIYIPTLKINQYYTYDKSMIYSRYGQELSKNFLYFKKK